MEQKIYDFDAALVITINFSWDGKYMIRWCSTRERDKLSFRIERKRVHPLCVVDRQTFTLPGINQAGKNEKE